jgi:hypothetical protein
MKLVRLKNKIASVFMLCNIFFASSNSHGKDAAVSLVAMGGANHNTIFKNPKLEPDTLFSPVEGGGTGFPSWGYYIGCFGQINIMKQINLFIKLGLQYDKHVEITKTDSITANFLKRYYHGDPNIRIVLRSYDIAVPTYFIYKYKLLSMELGLINNIINLNNYDFFLLSGKNIKTETSKSIFKIYSSWSASLDCEIIKNKLEIQIAYDHKLAYFYSSYYRLGLQYTFFKSSK